jgi:hypothetical protein
MTKPAGLSITRRRLVKRPKRPASGAGSLLIVLGPLCDPEFQKVPPNPTSKKPVKLAVVV